MTIWMTRCGSALSVLLHGRVQKREASSWRHGHAGQKAGLHFPCGWAAPQDTAENGLQSTTAGHVSMAMSEVMTVKSLHEARTAITLSSPDTPAPATAGTFAASLKVSMLSTSPRSLLHA